MTTVHAGAALTNNPFAGPVTAESGDSAEALEPVTELALRGVMIAPDPRNSMANISGELVYPGDSVGGYQVVEVGPGYALVTRGERHLRLSLEDDETN